MSLRVIAGKAKGRRLKQVPGSGTRPIMDKVKEALFNILGPWVQGSRWLDLFAGTGSVGIEALSRSATHVTFIELGRRAIKTIAENLEITGLEEDALVLRRDAFDYLNEPPETQEAGYDVIYVAPPQYKGIWVDALHKIDARVEWVYPDGLVIAQIDPNEYEELPLVNLRELEYRDYGSTRLVFYERPGYNEDDQKEQ